jgi:hypothetical protein
MNPKRRSLDDLFDPLDDDEEMDEFDGFVIIEVDTPDSMWETPLCLFGLGDGDGRCAKDRFGCHIEGCEYATRLD